MDYENLTPQYRIEEYLEAIVEGWVDATVVAYPDYPSWRLEEFLDAFITYIWEDGDHPRHPCPEPVWRLEECLRAIYDVMTGAATPWVFPLPPTNRIEEYLAAIHAYLADNTELPVPEPVWRIEQWLAYALDAVKQGGGIEKTVSGTMVHITDALAKAALSVLASIEPVQDLHGYDHPWPAGGGKNLVDPNATLYKRYLRDVGNGSYYWTYSEDSASIAIKVAPETSYTLSRYLTTGGIYRVSTIRVSSLPSASDTTDIPTYQNVRETTDTAFGTTRTITTDSSATYVVIQFNGATIRDFVVHGQFELGSTATEYSPYENICPISGRTGLNVYRTGKNLLDDSIKSFSAGGYVFFNTADDRYHKTTTLQAGTYTFSVTYSQAFETTKAHLRIYDVGTDTMLAGAYNATKISFTLTEITDIAIYVQNSGLTVSDILTAQLELGSTATTYESYSGNTYAVDWTTPAETVYGGTVDVVTGVLTVDMAMVDMGTLSYSVWNTSSSRDCYSVVLQDIRPRSDSGDNLPAISSIYVATNYNATWKPWQMSYTNQSKQVVFMTPHGEYADADAFKAAMSGVQLVYELATPLTYQLTAQEVQMLLGENNVWSSSGDTVSVTYYAEGNANPLQSLNILLGGNYSNPKTADDVSDKEALEIILGGNK